MSLEELKKLFVEKLGMKPEEFDKKVADTTAIFKKQFPNWTPEQVAQRTEVAIRGEFRSALRSRAVAFTGMFLGASEPYDIVARKRAQAAQMFLEDPAKAVQLNLTDANGVPLDSLATFSTGRPNPNFRKPLPEHQWLKNALGVFNSPTGEVKLGTMVLRDQLAEAELPLYTPLAFRANISSNSTEQMWVLNQSKYTEFVPTTVKMPTVGELLNSPIVKPLRVPLVNIEAWVAEHDNRTPILVDADVEAIGEPSEVTGNVLVMLNDAARDIEAPAIGCFVGPRNQKYIDFGIASRVSVIGTCRTTEFMEEETVNITCWGIYAYPELKTNRQPVITKDTTTIPAE